MPPGDDPGGGLFGPIFTTDELAEATSDHAWVAAMLEFEAALALAEASDGAGTVRGRHRYSAALPRMRSTWPPSVMPLVWAPARSSPSSPSCAGSCPAEAARWAHFGATSQDVLDTALMLVLRQRVRPGAGRPRSAGGGGGRPGRAVPLHR